MRALALAAACLVAACRTAPQVRPESAPPTLPKEDFAVVTQSLTQVSVRYAGTVAAEGDDVTVEKARWEFVVDGEVRRSGDKALGLSVAAGQQAEFSLEESLAYVKDEADLAAMDARGGSLLLALRGTLVLSVPVPAQGDQPASRRTVELPFARAKEVRTPRLPHLKLVEFEAGRFSAVEVQATFHLGVVNPNPFEVSLQGLDYAVTLAGKKVSGGTLGAGERVLPASTGVFDVTATLNEESHGKEAGKIVKGLAVPYALTGTLRTALSTEALDASGTIKLKPAK